METNRLINIFIAQNMYEEEIAKKLRIDPHTEYGRKRLNEYLEQEKQIDVQNAIAILKRKNPGKFIRLSEIRIEAERIKNERLAPYIEKANEISNNHQEESISQEQNGPTRNLTTKM